MHVNRLFLLTLMNLLFVNSKVREKRKLKSLSSYTGLLALTEAHIEFCHVCLLQKVGVEEKSLIASNKDTHVYLIKGRNEIIDLFLLLCNNGGNFCPLQTELNKFPPNSSILSQNSVLEYSLSLFLMHMGYVIPDGARHSERELFKLKSYGGVAFFLFYEIRTILRSLKDALKSRKNLLKRNTIDTLTTSFYIIPLMDKYLVEPQPNSSSFTPIVSSIRKRESFNVTGV